MAVRDTLLLACGTAATRGSLREMFENTFNILETDNCQQTLLFLNTNHKSIAAILLETSPQHEGCSDLLAEMKRLSLLEDIPVIVRFSQYSPQYAALAFEHGAAEVISAEDDATILYLRVQKTVELYRHKWQMEEVIEEQEDHLRHSNDAMVDALSSIIEYRSAESGQHILRVRHFTKILLEDIARNCPEYQLTGDIIDIISGASALHDIGKIAIPDAILKKPGKLTAEEWEVMKSHTLSGCHIIESLHDIGNQEYLRYAHNICHYHHERWDGKGYPEGISGDEIPICAQAVRLADVYDALTTKRVYKDAFSYEHAANMILNGDDGAFSPRILACFKHVLRQFEAQAKAYADGMSPQSEDFNVTLPGPDYQNGLDTLHMTQSKLYSLLHHVDSTAIEIDTAKGIYHVIYSPHLDLAPIASCTSISEATKILYTLVVPEEHDKLDVLIKEDFPAFIESGNRRRVFHFHVRSGISNHVTLYQMTLLRPHQYNGSQSILVLWQIGNELSAPKPDTDISAYFAPGDAVHGLLTGLLRYRNDRWFTLENESPQLAELLGYHADELFSQFHGHLIELVVPEDRDMVRRVISQQLTHSQSIAIGFRLRHRDGSTIWVLNKSHLTVEADGNEYLYGTLTDITHSQKIQAELYSNLERYRTILETMDCIIFEWNPETDQAYISQRWENFFGYPPLTKAVMERLTVASHFHPDDLPKIIQMFQDMKYGTLNYQALEVRIANIHGRYHWMRMRKSAVRDADGKLLKMVGILINIDDEKQTAQYLLEQAERDSLTKLLNKQAGRKQAEQYFSASSNEISGALLIIDLDNFKQINDRFGHMFGDAVLSQASKEIKKLFRAHDIISRIGGDEFMVLMKGISDRTLIEKRCEQLILSCRNLFAAQLHDCPLGCSIGIALAPEHGTTYTDLFKRADQALYLAKNNGKNRFCIFNTTDHSFYQKMQTLTAISATIDSDEEPELTARNLVLYTFQNLYDSVDVEATINEMLRLVGTQMNVSRVYIFENSADNKTCSNTFEWCNAGITPEIDNLQLISYETDIPGYEENFDEHGIFYCPDVKTLPQAAYEIVEAQGIKSMLQYAIRDNGVFRGYMGFDDCNTNRYWTKEQISTLTVFSETLSVFLLKKRAQDAYHAAISKQEP